MVGQEKQTLLERVVVVTEKTSLNKCTALDLIKFIKGLN